MLPFLNHRNNRDGLVVNVVTVRALVPFHVLPLLSREGVSVMVNERGAAPFARKSTFQPREREGGGECRLVVTTRLE